MSITRGPMGRGQVSEKLTCKQNANSNYDSVYVHMIKQIKAPDVYKCASLCVGPLLVRRVGLLRLLGRRGGKCVIRNWKPRNASSNLHLFFHK